MAAKRVLKGGRGRALELRIKKRLEVLGWLVMRVPGSRGPVDLVAMWGEPGRERWARVAYIRAKSDGRIGPRERLALAAEAKKDGAEAFVVDGAYRVRDATDWRGSNWQDLLDTF